MVYTFFIDNFIFGRAKMYEFEYISAANASVEEIKKAREEILDNMQKRLNALLPEGTTLVEHKIKKTDDAQQGENSVYDESQYAYSDEDSMAFIEEIRPLKDEDEPEEGENEEADDNLPMEISLSEEDLTKINAIYGTIKHLRKGLNVVINISSPAKEDIKKNYIDALLDKAKQLELKLNVYVTGYSTFSDEKEHIRFNFSKELMTDLISLNNYLVEHGAGPLRFMEEPLYPYMSWTVEQVFNATAEVDSVVKTIQDNNFSPYEAAAYIHFYLSTNFPYLDNPEMPLVPRSLIGILNTDNIVCVGYSYFTKAVVDKLKMPGLKAETFVSSIKREKDKPSSIKTLYNYPTDGYVHQQVLYNINDPKYNISGNYASDACWDCLDEEFPDGKGFGNFMIPVGDLAHMRTQQYVYSAFERLVDKYDLSKYAKSKKTRTSIPAFIKNKMGNSPAIPSDKIESCLYTVFRKIFPEVSKQEIEEATKNYLIISKYVAAALYDDEAESSLAQEGKGVTQKDVLKAMSIEQE